MKIRTIEAMNLAMKDYFTDKQIRAMKDAVLTGCWGDCDMEFTGESHRAYGFFTNSVKDKGNFTSRQIGGIFSGISKRIKATRCALVLSFHNWWEDGRGDMLFFNTDFIDEVILEKWAETN